MKSDSDHISQSRQDEPERSPEKKIVTHETNCPDWPSSSCASSNMVSPENRKTSSPRSADPKAHVSRKCSSETRSSDPVQLPDSNSEWPPVNEARTLEGRLAQWDSFAKASSREMTMYDLDVIAFGRAVADQFPKVD
jgi:hypothetical protein